MVTLTTYAKNKFELLNRHKVFIREEQLEEVVLSPDSLKKNGKLYFAHRDGIGVVYQIEGGLKRIVTFYPIR
jgi:hypothetical protein